MKKDKITEDQRPRYMIFGNNAHDNRDAFQSIVYQTWHRRDAMVWQGEYQIITVFDRVDGVVIKESFGNDKG